MFFGGGREEERGFSRTDWHNSTMATLTSWLLESLNREAGKGRILSSETGGWTREQRAAMVQEEGAGAPNTPKSTKTTRGSKNRGNFNLNEERQSIPGCK